MTTTASPTAIRTDSSEPRVATDGNWGRSSAIAGIAFVVLDVVGTFLPGAPVASDASDAKIAAFFHDHGTGIKLQLVVAGFGIAALMWWFGGLWRMMSRAENDRPRVAAVAAMGLTAGLVLALLNGVVIATAALRVNDGAQITRLLYSLSFVVIAAAGFGLGVFLLATCVLAYRTQFVARWTCYVGGLAGIAFLASTLGATTDANAINQIGLVAFLAWCVWIIAVSTTMWRASTNEA